ncbi:hypothetical protein SLS58_009540 [Diplodia intermedia]|uniref:tyrosinase n=1 Tax=Diplodia intermedia TaxID=856260 RepID=A0ABR3TC55_9PEZI
MASITNAQSQGRVAGLASAVPNGQPIPQRLEIDDLVNDPDAFNLFLLALESIQKDKYKGITQPAAMQDKKQGQWQDRMSYFEIAGIHGLPNRPWDNVQSKTMFADQLEIGYCTHGSILFPTWHRPYLAMMEQTIFEAMREIAKLFNDPKYEKAARTFRLPYWDYFQPRRRENNQVDFGLPRVLKEEKLMVFRPEDKKNLVPMLNPLKSFAFPGTGSLAEEEWKAKINGQPLLRVYAESLYSREHTARHPLYKDRDKDDFAQLDDALDRDWRRQLTYQNLILSDAYKDYSSFASGRQTRPWNGSLEDFHGKYHITVGGPGGHMSETEVAAFDPIFWLHHCNIDRIFAIWQALNKDFIAMTDDPKHRADTPLYPFRLAEKKSDKEFWDSEASRSPTAFGYTYPDLVLRAGETSIRRKLDKKYSWSLQARLEPSAIRFSDDMKPISVEQAQAFQDTASQAVKNAGRRMMEQQVVSNPAPDIIPGEVPSFDRGDEILGDEPEGTRLVVQWFVDCEVEKDAIDGAFTIFYFVGPVSELNNDPHCCWQVEPNLAGFNHIFSARKANCSNCESQAEEGLVVTGTSPINSTLEDNIDAGKLQSLKPDDVGPFLKKKLFWRVVKANRTTEDPAQVSGLKVSVSATYSVFRPDDIMPQFKEGHFFPEITADHRSGDPAGQ